VNPASSSMAMEFLQRAQQILTGRLKTSLKSKTIAGRNILIELGELL